jgi:hypothetical protein
LSMVSASLLLLLRMPLFGGALRLVLVTSHGRHLFDHTGAGRTVVGRSVLKLMIYSDTSRHILVAARPGTSEFLRTGNVGRKEQDARRAVAQRCPCQAEQPSGGGKRGEDSAEIHTRFLETVVLRDAPFEVLTAER